MIEPSALSLLHAEYARLRQLKPDRLSADQALSLTYFVREQQLRDAQPGESQIPNAITRWLQNVFALEAFIARLNRMPRENRRLPANSISDEEKTLTAFVRAQRRAFAGARLCTYQERRLAAIEGFSFHPHDDVWISRVREYRDFITENGRVPRLRSHEDKEHSLAAWAAKQRLAYRRGRLSRERVRDLSGSGFWTWGR